MISPPVMEPYFTNKRYDLKIGTHASFQRPKIMSNQDLEDIYRYLLHTQISQASTPIVQTNIHWILHAIGAQLCQYGASSLHPTLVPKILERMVPFSKFLKDPIPDPCGLGRLRAKWHSSVKETERWLELVSQTSNRNEGEDHEKHVPKPVSGATHKSNTEKKSKFDHNGAPSKPNSPHKVPAMNEKDELLINKYGTADRVRTAISEFDRKFTSSNNSSALDKFALGRQEVRKMLDDNAIRRSLNTSPTRIPQAARTGGLPPGNESGHRSIIPNSRISNERKGRSLPMEPTSAKAGAAARRIKQAIDQASLPEGVVTVYSDPPRAKTATRPTAAKQTMISVSIPSHPTLRSERHATPNIEKSVDQADVEEYDSPLPGSAKRKPSAGSQPYNPGSSAIKKALRPTTKRTKITPVKEIVSAGPIELDENSQDPNFVPSPIKSVAARAKKDVKIAAEKKAKKGVVGERRVTRGMTKAV